MRAVLALGALALLFAGAVQAQVRCPAELTISEQPVPPPGMRGETAQRTRPLLRVSVFDGMPTEKFELAPTRSSRDGALTVQVFDLPEPRHRPAFIVCRYADTPATLSAPLPASVKRCVLRFVWNAQARRIEIGKSRPQTECS